MDERRRDKTNGMFKKCQEVIKENAWVLNRAYPVDDNNICLSSAIDELWR